VPKKETKSSLLDTLLKSGDIIVGMPKAEQVPTGVMPLDWLFHGGLPRGGVGFVWGKPRTGKSSSTLAMCAALISGTDRKVLYVDADHGMITTETRGDDYLLANGIDPERFYLVQTRNPNVIKKIVKEACISSSEEWGVVVIDSVSAYNRWEAHATKQGKVPVGVDASDTSQMIRESVSNLVRRKVALIMISHAHRDPNSGAWAPNGGVMVQHSCTWQLKTWDIWGKQPTNIQVDGHPSILWVTITMKRDRIFGVTDKTVIVPILTEPSAHGRSVGICLPLALLDFATGEGIVRKTANGWFSMGDSKIGHGLHNTLIALCKDIDLVMAIDEELRLRFCEHYDREFVRQRYIDSCMRTLEVIGGGK
jgi:hypothetical protein